MGEEALKQNLERAFVPPPGFPDDRLLSRTMSAISGSGAVPEQVARRERPRVPRAAVQWAAAAVVLVLAVAATTAFLALHRSAVPGTPTRAPVIFPTKMVSRTTGWAVTSRGSSQQIWHTTDGGLTWTLLAPPRALNRNGAGDTFFFLDESHAWITELVIAGAGSGSLVTVRTVDGGKTWQQGAPVGAKFGSSIAEYFLDANSGWLAITTGLMPNNEWPAVYVTTDGGLHWTLQASQAGQDSAPSGLMPGSADLTFVSSATGWLTIGLYTGRSTGSNGSGTAYFFARTMILVTHDGGRTWSNQPLPVAQPDGAILDAPVFFGSRQGVIVIHAIVPASPVATTLLVTSDAGRTWTARPLQWAYIWSIQFVDATHGWAVAGPGSDFVKFPDSQTIPLPLYRTDDGGLTWTPVTSNLNFLSGQDRVTDIHFVDQQTGFATVWNDGGPLEMLRSDDSGRNWSVVAECRSALGLSYPPPVCPAST